MITYSLPSRYHQINGSVVANGAGNNLSGHVGVYRYEGSWEQDGNVTDIFGHSQAMATDGDVVAVNVSSSRLNVYQHNTTNNIWEQVGGDIDIDVEVAGDYSGSFMSLS